MRTVRTPAIAALLSLALSACGGNDAEKAAAKAAAPLPEALEALGIHGLAWRMPRIEGDSIILIGAKAELDGVGDVRADQVVVTGFAQAEGGWSASLVKADIVEGGMSARRISIRSPKAKREGKAWAVTDDSRTLEGYDGPLMGLRVSAGFAASETAPATTGTPPTRRITTTGLRIPEATAPAALRPFADLDWSVSLRIVQPAPGRMLLSIEDIGAKGWSMRGIVALRGNAELSPALASLDPASVVDLTRWPAGVLLQEATLDMVLQAPGALVGKKAADRVASALAAASAAPAAWHVQASPPEAVPVRDIPRILQAPGADAKLGLAASGLGIEPVRDAAGGQGTPR